MTDAAERAAERIKTCGLPGGGRVELTADEVDASTSTPIRNQTVGRYCPASLALCMSRSHAVLRFAPQEPHVVNPDTSAAISGTSEAPCSVCRRLRAELELLQRYMVNAPDAEFGRENLEHVITVLLRIMDTPNVGIDAQEKGQK